ncbi:MAG: putative molybdenum carrier protein [Candidatus Hydrogenedentes bacterium]|nr:putative molybdenum carrier protein [Candidatus Hydrogenedentota bacterium]
MAEQREQLAIRKVVSGGQTGVDRAALDVALARNLACGGWCPKGRLAEDGAIHERYPLRETPGDQYAERTAWNVRDSDGTLILTWGPPSDGTAFTKEVADALGKPCLVIDLAEPHEPGDAAAWLAQREIRTLNVAGPRASKCPFIYDEATAFLGRLLDPPE